MDYEKWKADVVEYLREVEKKAGVEPFAWDWLVGDDETMKEEYAEGSYKDDPIGYVDYQIECAQ